MWIPFDTEPSETKLNRNCVWYQKVPALSGSQWGGSRSNHWAFQTRGPAAHLLSLFQTCSCCPWQHAMHSIWTGNAAEYPSETSVWTACSGLILAYYRFPGLTLDAHLPKTMRCRSLKDIGFGIICMRIRPSSIPQAFLRLQCPA